MSEKLEIRGQVAYAQSVLAATANLLAIAEYCSGQPDLISDVYIGRPDGIFSLPSSLIAFSAVPNQLFGCVLNLEEMPDGMAGLSINMHTFGGILRHKFGEQRRPTEYGTGLCQRLTSGLTRIDILPPEINADQYMTSVPNPGIGTMVNSGLPERVLGKMFGGYGISTGNPNHILAYLILGAKVFRENEGKIVIDDSVWDSAINDLRSNSPTLPKNYIAGSVHPSGLAANPSGRVNHHSFRQQAKYGGVLAL